MKKISLILLLFISVMIVGCGDQGMGLPYDVEVFIDSGLDSLTYRVNTEYMQAPEEHTIKNFPHTYKGQSNGGGVFVLYAIKDTGVVQLNFKTDGREESKYLIPTPCEKLSFQFTDGRSNDGLVDPI